MAQASENYLIEYMIMTSTMISAIQIKALNLLVLNLEELTTFLTQDVVALVVCLQIQVS